MNGRMISHNTSCVLFFIFSQFRKNCSKKKAIIFELHVIYAAQNSLVCGWTKIEANFKVIREVSRKALNVQQSLSIP